MIQLARPPVALADGDSSAQIEEEAPWIGFTAGEFSTDPAKGESKPLELMASAKSVTGSRMKPKRSPAEVSKADSVTGSKAVAAPAKKRTVKPPAITGYHWRDDGAGWQLRKAVTENGKRKFRYVGHLSKSAYRELKRAHKGAALNDALAKWVAGRGEGKQ